MTFKENVMALIAMEKKGPVRASLSKYGELWVTLAYRFDRNFNDRREFEFDNAHDAIARMGELLDAESDVWKGVRR